MDKMIADIVTIPGLNATGNILQIGVRLANGRIFWSLCDMPTPPPNLSTIQAALVGQPVEQFRPLAEQLATLTETTAMIRPIALPENAPAKLSRRALFVELLTAEQPGPKTEQIIENRPFPAPLQYALTTALLIAVADHRHQPMAEMIAQEYELEMDKTAVSLCYALSSLDVSTIPPAYRSQITAVYYTINGQDVEAELGKNGELLQRQVRQVAGGLGDRVQIYLNVKGGFGRLYANNVGKLLGALYGLEQAAKPCQVCVVDAVVDDLPLLYQLKEYVGLRKLAVQLGIEVGNDALQPALEAGAVHFLSLQPAHLGNLHHTIQAILACRKKNIPVMLHGTRPEIIHLAMATQAAVVSGKNLSQAFNEREKLRET